MGQTAFIVWRESVEALLIVGILLSWVRSGGARTRQALPWLWTGVALGVAMAVLAGYLLVAFNDALDSNFQTYFQIGIVLSASALIVRMAFWMRKNGRTMKSGLVASLERQSESRMRWALLWLTALAITREGSECAVFLYGASVAQAGGGNFPVAVAIGLLAAILSFGLLQLRGKLVSWRRFFQLSELVLLFLAAGLLLTGLEKSIDFVLENTDISARFPLLDMLTARAWDSRWLLDDGTVVGGMLSTLTGYRSQPVYMSLLIYGLYWCAIVLGMRRMSAGARVASSQSLS